MPCHPDETAIPSWCQGRPTILHAQHRRSSTPALSIHARLRQQAALKVPHLGHPIPLICSSYQVFSGQRTKCVVGCVVGNDPRSKFFLPKSCHTNPFKDYSNDSLSVPRSSLTFPFRPKSTGAQWVSGIKVPSNSHNFRRNGVLLLWDLLWDLQPRVMGYEGVANSVRCPSLTPI